MSLFRITQYSFSAAALLVAVAASGCTRTVYVREPPPTVSRTENQTLRPAYGRTARTTMSDYRVRGLGTNGWVSGSVGASVMSPLSIRPDELKWGAAPPVLSPGATLAVIEGDPSASGKLFTIRLRMPDGYRISPHWHFADEHVTIISGTFKLGHGDTFDTATMDTLPAGGFAVLPARHHHYAMAQGATEVQVHALGPWKLIYVNPADDPSKSQGQTPTTYSY